MAGVGVGHVEIPLIAVTPDDVLYKAAWDLIGDLDILLLGLDREDDLGRWRLQRPQDFGQVGKRFRSIKGVVGVFQAQANLIAFVGKLHPANYPALVDDFVGTRVVLQHGAPISSPYLRVYKYPGATMSNTP